MCSNSAVQLSQLAEQFGCLLKGSDVTITGVAGIDAATPASLVCLRDKRHAETAKHCGAGAILTTDLLSGDLPEPLLVTDDPHLAFIRIQRLFLNAPAVHTAPEMTFVHPTASVSDSALLAPFCYVGAHAAIGPDVILESGVRVMDGAVIGERTRLSPNVVVMENCRVGSDCMIGPSTVIGSEGYGYHFAEGRHHKVPQTGIVVIENDVEIGACVTIDRATFGETTIGEGTRIDNQVQIAHNVHIGNHVIIVAQSGIAGSTDVGDYAVLAGKAGIVGHIRIGKGATVGGASVVTRSVPDGEFVTGYPAVPHREWKKQMVHLSRLSRLADQVKQLWKDRNPDKGTGEHTDRGSAEENR